MLAAKGVAWYFLPAVFLLDRRRSLYCHFLIGVEAISTSVEFRCCSRLCNAESQQVRSVRFYEDLQSPRLQQLFELPSSQPPLLQTLGARTREVSSVLPSYQLLWSDANSPVVFAEFPVGLHWVIHNRRQSEGKSAARTGARRKKVKVSDLSRNREGARKR